MYATRSSRRAFTLIELLVVIAIIAILAAILFPVFAQAREKARATSCLSNMKQANLAWSMYLQDYDETMVPFWVLGASDPQLVKAGVAQTWWPMLVNPYVKSWQIYHCPSGTDPDAEWGSGPNAWVGAWQQHSQIGYNYLALSIFWDCDSTIGVSLAQVNKPAQTISFTDSAYQGTNNPYPTNNRRGFSTVQAPAQYAAILPATHTCTWYNGVHGGWDWTTPGPKPNFTGWTIDRHSEGLNVGWVDGHCKFMKSSALTAGTNFGPGIAEADVRLTNPDTYLWGDLNSVFGQVP